MKIAQWLDIFATIVSFRRYNTKNDAQRKQFLGRGREKKKRKIIANFMMQ